MTSDNFMEQARAAASGDSVRALAGWMETAKTQMDGITYYQGLLDQIAKVFGESAYISDDGSVQDSPLRAKMPELVEALAASHKYEKERRIHWQGLAYTRMQVIDAITGVCTTEESCSIRAKAAIEKIKKDLMALNKYRNLCIAYGADVTEIDLERL